MKTNIFQRFTVLSVLITVAASINAQDSQPPTVPTGLQVIEVHDHALGINWTASSDNVGVTGYRIFVNGSPHGTSVDNEYLITSLAVNTQYSITVSAFDAAFNESAQSGSIIPSTSINGITGIVTDENNNPISGATVNLTVPGGSRSTSTDLNGEYSFADLQPGIYPLSVNTYSFDVHVYDGHRTFQNFILLGGLSEVHSVRILSSTTTSASLVGNIPTSNWDANWVRGVVWSTSPNITALNADTTRQLTSDLGVYVLDLYGLPANTTIYARAFANNTWGWSFGEELRFYTGCRSIILNETISNVSCGSGSDGSISIDHLDINPPYIYSWTGPGGFSASTNNISSLEPGTYEVTVRDSLGCETVKSFELSAPPVMNLFETIEHIDCFGNANGNISVGVTGGTMPYSYSWTGPNGFTSTQNSINGLEGGTYNLTVSDGGSCTVNEAYVILEPAELILSGDVSDISCHGLEDGSIDATRTGGTAPFSFTWDGPGFSSNDEDISSLAEGTYNLSVIDYEECVASASFNVLVPEPITVTETVFDVLCFGDNNGSIDISVNGGNQPYSFLWSNSEETEDLIGLTADTYTVVITDNNNCTWNSGDYIVGQPDEITVSEFLTHVSCYNGSDGAINISVNGGTEPYQINWSPGGPVDNLQDISAGIYNLNVTDDNSCNLSGFYEITQPEELVLSTVVTNVTCNGSNDGSVDLTVTGGTLPYTFNWSNGAVSEDLADLSPGNYSLDLSDGNSCQGQTSLGITEPDPIVITLDNVSNETCPGCSDGSIEITVAGGTPGYTFLWSGPGYNQGPEDPDGLIAGTYYLDLFDSHACDATQTAVVGLNSPLMVTNTDDSGYGSLRDAIIYANDNLGVDVISFNIPGPGPHTIQPLTMLNSIDDPTIIDGFTQPGASPNTNLPGTGMNSVMQIVIDGTSLTDEGEGQGLIIFAGNSTIRGLVFNNLNHRGISLWNNGGNIVEGNYFGTDANGSDTPGFGIGTFGVEISEQSHNNIIRGNLVSGNGGGEQNPGIIINNGSNGNRIVGNFIGTDISGTRTLPNSGSAINVGNSSDNIIGGPNDEDRNIIFGGVVLAGLGANDNKIIGNYIGPNVTGNYGLGSGGGISIYDQATGTEIGPGNVISGIVIGSPIVIGSNSSNTIVFGNRIGVNAEGTVVINNPNTGVVIENSAGNMIGGSEPGDGNIISGSTLNHGIHILGEFSINNTVAGNYIGTNADGDDTIMNHNHGVMISEAASNNVIGPDNLISGNGQAGVYLHGSETTSNAIIGNILGLNLEGNLSIHNGDGVLIDNAQGNTIGGDTEEDRNIISGNVDFGIHLLNEANDNTILGNFIGLNVEGNAQVPNRNGIEIGNSRKNIIGGSEKGEGNVISGNSGDGVHIWDANATGNHILGNIIGLDPTGKEIIGNETGIRLNTCVDNTVGGRSVGARNIISGNEIGIVIQGPDNVPEPRLNTVIGNYIGTDISGKLDLGNGHSGLFISAAEENQVGGSTREERNIISGNGSFGVLLIDKSHDNYIQGNFIGTDYSGTKKIPNLIGVHVLGAQNNFIGGSVSGEGNLISGNENEGILMYGPPGSPATGNKVYGNLIGPDISGVKPLGNETNGIRFDNLANSNMVGGLEANQGNVIAFNGNYGVVGAGFYDPSMSNSILSNSIHSHSAIGIDLHGIGIGDMVSPNDPGDGDVGSNGLQNFPELTSVSFSSGIVDISGSLNSIPESDYLLQFFVNNLANGTDYGEGQTYLGSQSVSTDANGDVSFDVTFPTMVRYGKVITATATDASGSTSEFSAAIGGAPSQILATGNMPLHYKINEGGIAYMLDGSDLEAVQNAFGSWAEIPTSSVDFEYDGTTPENRASATDGINLVTFNDESYLFTKGVLAVAAKTIVLDDLGGEAKITDADIIFNPEWHTSEYRFSTDTYEGYFDIQSVTAHEIGHIFGLVHSGVLESTMFFVIDDTNEKRSLEQDDISWASFRYQKQPEYDQAFGSISGHIDYGDDYGNDPPVITPVAGALVLATNTASGDVIHTYSDKLGDFTIPAVPFGTYHLTIEPLDGDVEGYPLTKENINDYILGITEYIDYPKEFLSDPEAEVETGSEPHVLVEVTESLDATGLYLITNMDVTRPEVLSITPEDGSSDIKVFSQVVIKFSEPVEMNTLTKENCYLSDGVDLVPGGFTPLDKSTQAIVFTPDKPLAFGTAFAMHINEGVKDLKENNLLSPIVSYFTTVSADEIHPSVTDVIPENNASNVLLHDNVQVFFSESMDPASTKEGFSLVDQSGATIDGAQKWDQENKVLTFDPYSGLKEGSSYTLSLNASLSDLALNSLDPEFTSTFTTLLAASPTIRFVGPVPDATNVSLKTPVLVDFSEPIDPTTIDASTVKLSLGGNAIPGKFEFLLDNTRVLFRPDVDLAPSTLYRIEISDQIYDVSQPSDNLTAGRDHTFTTVEIDVPPFIDYLTPVSGSVGTIVQVTGEGFDPNPENDKAFFNENDAVVFRADLNSMTSKVPLGAGPGPVYVEVLSQTSNSEFFYVMPDISNPCEQVIGSIRTGSNSQDVDIDPDGAFAYVTNSGSNSVSVINLETYAVETILLEGESPFKIDIHPNGELAYVTNLLSHDVSVIDLTTNTELYTIPVGVNPYGVVVTPDGSRIYVANYSSEDISVIDVDPNSGGFDKVVGRIKTGSNNGDIDITPDGGLAVVAGSDGVVILNTDPEDIDFNQVVRRVSSGSGTSGVDITPDGGMAFALTTDGYVLFIDVLPSSDAFGQVIGRVSSGSGSSDIDISPEGLFVYISNTENNSVSVYKIAYTGVPGASASYFLDLTLDFVHEINVEVILENGDSDGAPKGIIVDPFGERLLVAQDLSEGYVTIVNVCCGPLVIESAMGNLITSIRNAIDAGILSKGNGNALLVKLDHAFSRISKDRITDAINQLQAFINQVTAFVLNGILPPDVGNAWIEAANDIIHQLLAGQRELQGESVLVDITSNHILPSNLKLEQNYPNPFSHVTTIEFEIPFTGQKSVPVLMRMFNSSGQVVKNLISNEMNPGRYAVIWNRSNNDGTQVSDGIYLLELRTPDQRKMINISVIK